MRISLRSHRFVSVSRALALLVCVSLVACGKIEELSSSMSSDDSKSDKVEIEGAEDMSPEELARAEAEKKREQYWDSAKTFTKGQTDSSIARCTINGKMKFMRRAECESLGGRAGDV